MVAPAPLTPASDVTVERGARPDGEAPQAEVIIAGQPTGWRVPGAVLEAALRCNGRLLLFMTDDVPFEESLSLHLVDADGTLLDSVWLRGLYATGVFSGLVIESADTARFRFFGDTDWRVRVSERPRWRWPLLSDPRGVHRGLRLRRYLSVSGRPQPQPR